MRLPRFPIAALLGLVVFAAAAAAALRHGGSQEWDSAWLAAVLLGLLAAALLAIHRRGKARAFWLGFVLWGAAYFAVIQSDALRARLPTTRALSYLSGLYPQEVVDLSRLSPTERDETVARLEAESPDYVIYSVDPGSGALRLARGGVGEFYYPIGHSIWTLLLALAGGLASALIRRPDPVPTEANPPCPAASSSSP